MILDFFSTLLYEPLFNLLVWIYNNYTEQNFGIAVIIMTVGFRLVMLPLSIIAERNKLRYAALGQEIKGIRRDYRKDPVAMNQRIRRLFEEHGINPWAKTTILLLQAVLFLVLYWVFLRGVNSQRISEILYPFIDHPGIISTEFYGFNIAKPSAFWAGIVGVTMFLVISVEQWGHRVSKSDFYFRILFPLAFFIVLLLLPMVKALFFLSSITFSFVIVLFRRIFIKTPKSA